MTYEDKSVPIVKRHVTSEAMIYEDESAPIVKYTQAHLPTLEKPTALLQ
jgi:hypothetical protein